MSPDLASNLRHLLRARWRLIASVAIGLAAGYVLGSQYAWDESSDHGGFFPAELMITLVSVATIGGAGLLGVLLLLGDTTRYAGKYLLLTAAIALVGWPIGNALGTRWQEPVAHLGEAVLELDEPAGTRLVGPVTCWTKDNSDVIVSIGGGQMGDVGVDRVGVSLSIRLGTASARASGTVELSVNDRSGYGGHVILSDLTPRHASGRATFSEVHPGRTRIGGWSLSGDSSVPTLPGVPTGLESLSGSVAWSCASAPAPIRSPVDVPLHWLDGWFTVESPDPMPRTCRDNRVCFPYGDAVGTCSTESALGVDALETVVPWRDGKRARLRLVPDRTSATLTVTVDDGRPAETIRSAPTLVEPRSGSTGEWSLDATFALSDGDLGLRVSWSCG